MAEKFFIPLLLGTNREGRESEKVARFLLAETAKRPEIVTKFFDARDFAIPKNGYGESIKDMFPEYKEAIIRADGLIIVSPEYNHGYPGTLKFVLDLLLDEYRHKPVGLVGVSNGSFGGARLIEQLVQITRTMGLVAMKKDLSFPKAQEQFNEDGTPKDEKYYGRVGAFLDELVWLASALKWGRENLPIEKARKI